jgi:16S rRNA (uracil1498-N3)-methyltransferase
MMRTPRLYAPPPLTSGSEILPDPESTHYLRHVLRLADDHPVILFDGLGHEYDARIRTPSKGRTGLAVGTVRQQVERESGLKVWLYLSLARSTKMDWIIEKATELGVAGIQPVTTHRSAVPARQERQDARLRHWNALARSACAQCGRSWVPPCHPPLTWPAFLHLPTQPGARFVLTPDAPHGFGLGPIRGQSVHLLVGPEGGFEEKELGAVLDLGYEPVRLGPRILRSETAPLAALAVLQALWGDLNDPPTPRPEPA